MQALVLTPTRELCIQVTQALRTYGAHSGIDVVAVFGGAPIRTQQAQLRAGGHVVVGTVGRVLDLISRHSLVLHDCRFLVLDEADEMLDLGFLEDVEKILSLTPSSRQTALFSATMPPPIRKLADRYMYDPEIIQVEAATLTIDTVAQFQLPVETKDKPDKLVEVLRAETPEPGDRVRAHEDPLRPAVPHAARPRHERARAARRHVAGLARRRDARVQGRARADPRRHRRGRPRPGHLDGDARRSTTTCPPAPTPTCTASGAPAASGARAARSRSSRTARSASWRRSNATSARTIAQWEQGAVARARRPCASARAGTPSRGSRGATTSEAYTKLVLGGGRAAGLSVADIVASVTSSAGLDGEAVRDVLVLDRFSFLSVPGVGGRPGDRGARRPRDRRPRRRPAREPRAREGQVGATVVDV